MHSMLLIIALTDDEVDKYLRGKHEYTMHGAIFKNILAFTSRWKSRSCMNFYELAQFTS